MLQSFMSRLVDYPTRVDHLVGMIVLAKQGAESLYAAKPPSSGKATPVMKDASGEQR